MKRPPLKQPTPIEIRDELLRFIQTKFYQGDQVSFLKDRPRLLKWVILKLADYLDDKAVTIPAGRYLEIMRDKVLMNAVRFGKTEQIKYRPAWLGVVVDQHLAHHGEEYYEEAKSIRNLVDNALTIAHSRPVHDQPDPVRELARAARLLDGRNSPKMAAKKRVKNDQLSLL
jgi:hypothetical protein